MNRSENEMKWKNLVTEYNSRYTGSRMAFCKERGINLRSFYYWHKRLSVKRKNLFTNTFTPIMVSPSEKLLEHKKALKINFPNGLSAEILVGLPELGQILEACRQCC